SVVNAPAQLAMRMADSRSRPSARHAMNVPAKASPAPTVSMGLTLSVGTSRESPELKQTVDCAPRVMIREPILYFCKALTQAARPDRKFCAGRLKIARASPALTIKQSSLAVPQGNLSCSGEGFKPTGIPARLASLSTARLALAGISNCNKM